MAELYGEPGSDQATDAEQPADNACSHMDSQKHQTPPRSGENAMTPSPFRVTVGNAKPVEEGCSMKKRVTGVSHAGASRDGQTALWTLTFEDGSQEEYSCDESLLAILLQALQIAGQAAQAARMGLVPQAMSVAHMHRAIDVRSGRSGDEIVLQFRTAPGIPVLVSMPENLADLTIQRISEAQRLQKKTRSDLN